MNGSGTFRITLRAVDRATPRLLYIAWLLADGRCNCWNVARGHDIDCRLRGIGRR